MTLKAFKYRLYSTESQSVKINQTIGCTRLIYNLMLDAKQKHYEQYKKTLNVTPAKFKQDEKYSFLKEVDSLALANAQLNLNTAYNNFFKRPEVLCFLYKNLNDFKIPTEHRNKMQVENKTSCKYSIKKKTKSCLLKPEAHGL